MLHEIALRTRGFDRQLPKYRAYRPVGSIECVCSARCKVWMGCQIVCDFAAPYKREAKRRLFQANLGWTQRQWNAVVGAWSPERYDQWRLISQLWPTADAMGAALDHDVLAKLVSPAERLAASAAMAEASHSWSETYLRVRDNAMDNLWAGIVNTPGWSDELGKDPHGDVWLHDTWLWSARERCNHFVVTMDSMTSDDVEALQGFTGDDGHEVRDGAGTVVAARRFKLDWETRLGLSSATLATIRDPATAVNPRFNYPIDPGLVEAIAL